MSSLKKQIIEKERVLSIFVTAGYPERDSLLKVIPELEKSGVDFVEIGIPFSDPLADGATIQESSQIALNNGMTLELLLEQLEELNRQISVPIVLMGYVNPVLQYGLGKFLAKCRNLKVAGLIIPDISFDLYCSHYKEIFESSGVPLIHLVTADSKEQRIRSIDDQSKEFIYVLSSSSTTGKSQGFADEQKDLFRKVQELGLHHPTMLGFGIHDSESFEEACRYFDGAIIGSAFIRHLEKGLEPAEFVRSIKG